MIVFTSMLRSLGFFLASILVQNNLKVERKKFFSLSFVLFVILDIFIFHKGYLGFLTLVIYTFLIELLALKNSNFKSVLNTGIIISIMMISQIVVSIQFILLNTQFLINNSILIKLITMQIFTFLLIIFIGRHINYRIKQHYFVSNTYYTRLIVIDSVILLPILFALNYIYRYVKFHAAEIFQIEGLSIIFLIFLCIFIIMSFMYIYVMNIFLLSRKKFSKILSEAEYDELTQVYNRKSGMRKIKDLYSQNKLFKNNLVVCFLDVNNLKLVKDRFGHPEGDELIKTVAGIVKNSLRNIDFMVRYGGDEFIVIFQNCSIKDAKNAWKRIRAKFEMINYRLEKPYRISVSAGFASMDKHPDFTAEELIDIADVRMYSNKRVYKSQLSGQQEDRIL